MIYSDQADIAGRKLEIRYDHPALSADLFTPLVHAKDLPVLYRLLKVKHRGMDLSREAAKTIRVDNVLGVGLTPVQEVGTYSPDLYHQLTLSLG